MLKNEHEQLVKVMSFWKDSLDKADLFDREIVNDIDVRSKEVIDLTGVRRSGKSSILKLLIKKLALSDNFIFINFEDPYFIEHNNPSVIEEIVEIYKEYFSHNLKYLFFDEIHVFLAISQLPNCFFPIFNYMNFIKKEIFKVM